jgi:uncharacterized LabA/DUF88 family protein
MTQSVHVPRQRSIVYVDGFNLYYGALKGTAYKWLDPVHLAKLLFRHHDIQRVKYFTALVAARPHDPNQPQRQQTYLRALRTLLDLEIILGRFYVSYPRMRLRNPPSAGPVTVQVIKTEEKGSDVNIAAHLLSDAYEGSFDVAVVISNDSDLVLPIEMVTKRLSRRVDLVSPFPAVAFDLKNVSSTYRRLRQGPLKASQLPTTLTDANGIFSKPASW